jgi:hypothetical protein
METPAASSPRRPGRAILRGLLDLRPSPTVERTAVSADDAVARGLALAKVYSFASVDYPGAAQSLVFDSDGTTAVGAFVFDPGSGTSRATAFTFAGGVYQILSVHELKREHRYGHQRRWVDRGGARRSGRRGARLRQEWRHL